MGSLGGVRRVRGKMCLVLLTFTAMHYLLALYTTHRCMYLIYVYVVSTYVCVTLCMWKDLLSLFPDGAGLLEPRRRGLLWGLLGDL